MARLIVLSGLPGTGKSAIARGVAESCGAIWLRIDSIERAIRQSGVVPGSLDDAGYRAAYAVAEDNLRLGLDVISDSVNPWMLSRNAWRDAGVRAGAHVFEIEILCSDTVEHRRRVETRRQADASFDHPDWQAVIGRDYRAWDRQHMTIDTASIDLAASVQAALAALRTDAA